MNNLDKFVVIKKRKRKSCKVNKYNLNQHFL